MIPKRRKRPKMGVRQNNGRLILEAHAKWVRLHECLVAGCSTRTPCYGRIEAHHVRERPEAAVLEQRRIERGADMVSAPGAQRRPDDCELVPLCSQHHSELHSRGHKTFERMYGLDLDRIAADLWMKSPHRLKWERDRNEA